MKPFSKKTLKFLPYIISLLITAAVLVVENFEWVNNYELNTLDFRFQNFSKFEEPDTNICFVYIDNYTLEKLEPILGRWPYPREIHSYLIDYLARGNPKLIVYDILFAGHDSTKISEDSSNLESDLALAYSVEQTDVVAIMSMDENEQTAKDTTTTMIQRTQEELERIERYSFPLSINKADIDIVEYRNPTTPYPELLDALKGVGHSNGELDADNTLRRAVPWLKHKGRYYPSLAMAALIQILNLNQDNVSLENGKMILGNKEVPIDENGLFPVNFRNKINAYKRKSFVELFFSELQILEGQEPQVDPSIYKDKIIFIGTSGKGLVDLYGSPIGNRFPGVELHGTMVDNILNDDYYSKLDFKIYALILILFTLWITWYQIKNNDIIAKMITLIFVFLFVLCAGYIFQYYRIWIPIVTFLINYATVFIFVISYGYLTSGREQRFLKKTFQRYVSPDVVNEVIENPELQHLGGLKQVMSVVFSDIKSFTTITESIEDPRELVTFLNEYFTEVTEAIFRHKGTLDKYIGDAIMAFWGAPIKREDHAFLACYAVLEMRRISNEITANAKQLGKPEMFTRFGVNTGEMVVGNIGSDIRTDYTVIGDSVNLGSRLEGINKVYGTQVIVSEFTKAEIGNKFITRKLDRIVVKGKTKPVEIFELIDKYSLENQEKNFDWIMAFEEGLKFYFQQNGTKAISAFEETQKIRGGDSACETFIDRCKYLMKEPPEQNWNGAFQMKTK